MNHAEDTNVFGECVTCHPSVPNGAVQAASLPFTLEASGVASQRSLHELQLFLHVL